VLAANPNFGAALNNLAYLYTEKLVNLDKAFDLAQRARKNLPNDPNVADTLGWVLFKRHQYTWGLGLLLENAATLRTEPEAQYHLGMLQYMLGDEAAARASFERALQTGRDFAGSDQMKDRLAVLAIDVKSASPAERTLLEKAAADRPGDPVVLSRLVSIYQRDHQVDKAIAACERATAANPRDVAALTLLARLYLGNGETAKGFELAKNAHNLAPNDATVSAVLGRLAYAMHDYRWSLSLLRDSVASRPNDPDVQYDLARALYSVGSIGDAQVAARRALDSKASFDRSAEAQSFLDVIALSADPGRVLSESERIEGILKTDPDNVPALMAAGEANEQKGNSTAAVGYFEKVLAHFPDFSPAERRLIILYSKNSADSTKGYELVPKAREAFPKDPEVARACGVVDYMHGDYRRAEDLLAESASQLNGDAEAVYYLGMAQYRLKEKSSKSTLERALGMDLNTELAAEVRRTLSEIH
jgi:tetratricopeptide (TPR) repeat protein